jgi:ferritin-like metal-binding protein YciE
MEKTATKTRAGSREHAEPVKTDLGKAFEHHLKDIYFAENAILKALPKMAAGAQSSELKEAFENHQKQTEDHVARLEDVFELIGREAEGRPCEAIKGIIKEGDEVAHKFGKTKACDAALAAAAQAVEHYEITRYGALKAWAKELGLDEAVNLLQATEKEEAEADKLLSKLASSFNSAAAQAA